MHASENRKPSPDARRNAILDIAHAAFMRDGYAGTSMARIAAELGGSKTTLYNHFTSKRELFDAVADRECLKLLDQVFVVTATAGTFRERLAALCRRVLGALLEENNIASQRLIVAEAGRFPEVGQAAYKLGLERGIQRLSAWFGEAIAAGEMRRADARQAAEQFFDLAAGNLHRRRLWNTIGEVESDVIASEAERIANTFIAAFGNDALSRAARSA